jgi:predicted metal-dependent phosphoesterase TrpH
MTLLKDIEIIENGAQFLNADLHIHSFGASTDVKDATMSPKAIIDSAIKQGLSVIAITDHNSTKNIDVALEEAEHYAGRLLMVPGIEVTTSHGHLLAYFDPSRSPDLEKFLSHLDLIGPMGGENYILQSQWLM